MLDAIFIAPFYCPSFRQFWRDSFAYYADGESVNGFFTVAFGWVGDILGAVVGSIVGSVAGAILFIPDSVLLGVRWSLLATFKLLDDFSKSIQNYALFYDYAYQGPDSYKKKSWNISLATLGRTLGAILYGPCRLLESFLPIGNVMSSIAWHGGIRIGAAVGAVVAMPLYPVYRTLKNAISLFDGFRRVILDSVALVYAKTNAEIYQQRDNGDCNCFPSEVVHSQQFRRKVNTFKQSSMMSVFYGPPSRIAEGKSAVQHVSENDDSPLVDPISKERFKDPVIARCGHTFERSKIQEWIRVNPTCPLERQPIAVADLVPNRALKEVMNANEFKQNRI